jgi:cephalosporin-C deacetylase-like acetyl esterase
MEPAPPPLSRDMLAQHLLRRFVRLGAENATRRAVVRDAAGWAGERHRLLAAYRAALGPFPERTPLAPRRTGLLERRGYRIEKLLFESQPGLLVTALAYVPDGAGPFPGVLVPCGHTENGKAGETYQRLCIGLAGKGYFVLTYDPIGQGERKLYWDGAAGASVLGGCTTQHSYAGNQCFLAGINLAQLMVWDSLRAIDLLADRPEVDRDRLGMAGNSGGGTNTAFTAPLDERIAVAVACCYITTLAWRRRAGSTGDAEQNLVGSLPAGLDHADLLRLVAPRPVLVGSAALDFFPLQGAVESVAAARQLYATLDAPEAIDHAVAEAPHGYSVDLRRATYRWLNRWLGVDAGDDEPDATVETDADLQVTATGQVSLLGAPAVHDLIRRRLDAPTPDRTLSVPAAARRLTAFEGTDERPAARPASVDLYRLEGVRQVDRITLWPEADLAVPGAIWTWRGGPGPLRPLLWVDREGVEALTARPAFRTLLERLLPAGWLFMAVDVRGRGDTTPRSNGRAHPAMDAESFLAYEALVLGRPLFGMRMRDAQAAIDYLTARPDVAPGGVALAAWGAGGLLALHLAALDPRVRAVATVDTLASYRSLVEHEHYRFPTGAIVPGVVRGPDSPEGYEVDDLAAGIENGEGAAPGRPLLRLRNVDHLGEPVDPVPVDDAALATALLSWLEGLPPPPA